MKARLKRYSKQRGPGDQTSGGRGKLLRPGTGLSRVELAVRETLQNSWDARLGSDTPLYRVRVHRLAREATTLLSERVFTDLPKSLSTLATSLASAELHAIEFSDRGTTGLDGPTRASDVAPEGERNNFNSFVFDIGTTKSSRRAGGTFGFGKTATFEVSDAHTVVYWTRCRTIDGGLEHRLIASTLHSPYDEDGVRFTGAHWWGDPEDIDIAPLKGADAEMLGRALFRTHFGPDETGTSILVLDPVILVADESDPSSAEATPLRRIPVRTDQQAHQLVSQIEQGLAVNGWPKMVPQVDAHAPMRIELFHEDIDLQIAGSTQSSYATYADALSQVRQRQTAFASPLPSSSRPADLVRENTFPIRLRPNGVTAETRHTFFGGRADQVVGHLHIQVNVRSSGSPSKAAPANALCLMRSEAELVVRYEQVVDYFDGVMQWCGVFKPTPECDHHFAASEPPTHDGWNPSSAESEISAYVVEKALHQIRRKTLDYLSEYKPPSSDSHHSVRAVAIGLRSFVPLGTADLHESEHRETWTRVSSKRTSKPAELVELVSALPLADAHGQRLTIRADPASGPVRVAAMAHAITSEGRLALAPEEVHLSWPQTAVTSADQREVDLLPGEVAVLELRTRMRAAVEIELIAVPLS